MKTWGRVGPQLVPVAYRNAPGSSNPGNRPSPPRRAEAGPGAWFLGVAPGHLSGGTELARKECRRVP